MFFKKTPKAMNYGKVVGLAVLGAVVGMIVGLFIGMLMYYVSVLVGGAEAVGTTLPTLGIASFLSMRFGAALGAVAGLFVGYKSL